MKGIARLIGLFGAVVVLAVAGMGNAADRAARSGPAPDWPVHDPGRPLPPVVTPGPVGAPLPPPSDAVVLLAGSDLTGWEDDAGKPARWTPGDSWVEVADKAGSIRTRLGFGDCQFPPLVNACRKPGEWQTYDIVFHRPRFDEKGGLRTPARMTVLHNGVLVHDNVALTGPTAHRARPPYKAHADRLPISLQDHGCPVRYRNIWVRDLEGRS